MTKGTDSIIRLSPILNNCGLHALTPEIKAEVLKFAENDQYDNKHKLGYERLKTQFACFYDIPEQELSWKKFADILKSYNEYDTQIILGLVLREFITEESLQDATQPEWLPNALVLPLLIVTDHPNITVNEIKEYSKKLREIDKVSGRYQSLGPDHIFRCVAQYLGLNLCYKKGGSQETLKARDPVHTVSIYHEGSIEGAENGGHWERTEEKSLLCDLKDDKGTRLNPFFFLLGEDSFRNKYGFYFLKRHVLLSHQKSSEIDNQIKELERSASEIQQFCYNIMWVKKDLAQELLGTPLADKTSEFIQQYQDEVPEKDGVLERYINLKQNDPPPLPPDKQDIYARLTAKLNNPNIQIANKLPTVTSASEATTLQSEPQQPRVPDSSPPEQALIGDNGKVINYSIEFSKKFNENLDLLNKKVTKFSDKGLEGAKCAATNLHAALESAWNLYKNNPTNYEQFKKSCNTAIEKNRPVLEKHRGCAKIIANIVALLLSGVVGYLLASGINTAVNKKRFTFFSATDTALKIDEIEDCIKNLGPTGSS